MPLCDTWKPLSMKLIWISPALMTASMAVARSSGFSVIRRRGCASASASPCPPCRAGMIDTSSMNCLMRKMPRPLDLSTFSGVNGSLRRRDRNPFPWSRTHTMKSAGSVSGLAREIDEDELGRVVVVAVVMALMTDSRTAIAVQCSDSSSRPELPRDVFGDRLNEVQRVYRAVDFEMHILETAGHRFGRSIVSRWLQSPLRR